MEKKQIRSVEGSKIPESKQIEFGMHSNVVRLLGGSRVIKRKLETQLDWIELVRMGLPSKAIKILAEKISFSDEEISVVIHISPRSLQRWTTKERKLDKDVSMKMVELAKLFTKGESVFGSIENFTLWLRMSSPIFNNKKPLDLLDTNIGFNLINDELGKMEFGIFA